jgi:4-amino-4-deoxy-L-arabinose transferase-like glycosyltransferase
MRDDRPTAKQFAAALTCGLGLRLFFNYHFPARSFDTRFYEELAANWRYHGVYGIFVQGQLLPVDMRMPGYPAFLAVIHRMFGASAKPVMRVQAIVDLWTCVLTAALAARLAPSPQRARVATAALWMAALCPFLANYTAALLTETLATFFTVAALYLFASILEDPRLRMPSASLDADLLLSSAGWWLLAGALVGVGTLVRPDALLILAAAGAALLISWHRRSDAAKLLLASAWITAGLLLVLLPWAARNARNLGRVQFLSPRYAESYGDFIPRGFFAWTRTWSEHFRDAYQVSWKLGKQRIEMDSFPTSAFDSGEERDRVAELVNLYNADLKMTPALDRQFAGLARERARRHPFREYVTIPVTRIAAIWFTPRIELLPYSGRLVPPLERWRGNPRDFGATSVFVLMNAAYIGLALGGWIRRRRSLLSGPAMVMLTAFIGIRTAFLTTLQTVEPRYVMVCFPALLAIGAQAWASSLCVEQTAPYSTPAAPELLAPGNTGMRLWS